MSEHLDHDQLNRLWEHGLHEDNVFNERLNFFLVFESVLLGVVGVLYSTPTPKMFVLRMIGILGLALTIIWGYVQARQKYVRDGIHARHRDLLPEFRTTVEQRQQVKWPISNTWLLTYAIPSLVALVWIALLLSM